MNGIDYLLDTNILIYILQGKHQVRYFAEADFFALSVISEMELLGRYQIDPIEESNIRSMLSDSCIFDMDSSVKQEAIALRQRYRIKLPDAIVAATAIQKRLTLVTADAGFQKISDLDLILISL